MIARFNCTQIALAVLNVVAGILGAVLTVAVVHYGADFVLGFLGVGTNPTATVGAGLAILAIGTVASLCLRHRRTALDAEADTLLFPDSRLLTAGSPFVHAEGSRILVPAYLLLQVTLSAPLRFLEAHDRLRSLIPDSPDLNQELATLLADIDATAAWRPVRHYAGREQQLAYLVRMNRVAFSPRKGTVAPK